MNLLPARSQCRRARARRQRRDSPATRPTQQVGAAQQVGARRRGPARRAARKATPERRGE